MEKIEIQKLNGKTKGKTKWEQSETAEKKSKTMQNRGKKQKPGRKMEETAGVKRKRVIGKKTRKRAERE